MASCSKCNSSLPEGLRFCTQCGAPLVSPDTEAPEPVLDVFEPEALDRPERAGPATPVRRSPVPSALRPDLSTPVRRPGTGIPLDEERIRGVPSTPGEAICKFCKGPLDLAGDFCEQCGAPVEEAAPPGVARRRPKPTPAPGAEAATPAQVAPPSPPAAKARYKSSSAARPPAAQRPTSNVATPPVTPGAVLAPTPRPAVAAPPSVYAAPPTAEETAPAAAKPSQKIPLAIGVALVAAGLVGTGWYFLRPRPRPEVAPPPVQTTPAPETLPATEEASAPRLSRPKKAAPGAAKAPAADSRRTEIVNLQTLAQNAYATGNYAEPPEANAIAYAKRVLALDPADDYSKQLLEDSVKGGRYQIQQAITHKDFAAAHRVASALAQQLSGRSDVAGFEQDVAAAERAAKAPSQPAAAAATGSRFPLYHMHSDKSPADRGPYCLGTLVVNGPSLKYTAESATDGKLHNFEISCDVIREIKKNARVASRQGGFHVRTGSANFNFVPVDPSTGVVPALLTACEM